jgi:hypothetical protein
MNHTTIGNITTELYAVKDKVPGDRYDSWHICMGQFVLFWCYRSEEDKHLSLTDLGEQEVEYLPPGKLFVEISDVLEYIKTEMERK